jgi:hypothetical protein
LKPEITGHICILLMICSVTVDLSRVILYRSRSLRCEMRCEIHFEQNVSMIVCLERINDMPRFKVTSVMSL